MHAESRGGIYFADTAADASIALGDVGRQEVHATHVETDGAHRALGHLAIVRVDHVGYIGRGAAGRKVGGRAKVDDLPGLRHRLRGQSGPVEHLLRLRVELEPRQHLLVADAAARVLVHDLDQLRHRVRAVAHHVTWRAARGRDHLAVHHQQSMVVAFEVGLDDNRARLLARHRIALRDLLVAGESYRDAAPVVAVVGLGDDRETDAASRTHRLRLALHELLPGHGQPQRRQDLVRLFLVARELDCDVRSPARDGRLDALLVPAMPELYQRLVVQPEPRYATRLRGAHQRRRGRPQRTALREADELVARLGPAPVVRHRVGRANAFRQQRTEQPQAELAGRDAFVALRVFVDDRVNTRLVGTSGLAEGDRLAGDILQLDRHVLEYVAQPGSFVLAHAPEEAARLPIRAAVLGETGQGLGKRVDKCSAEPARGPRLQCSEVQLEADDRKVGVLRRADVDGTVEDAHSFAATANRRVERAMMAQHKARA